MTLPVPIDVSVIPLPDTGDWRVRLLREYLASLGHDTLPLDPREMSGYRGFLTCKGYKPNSIAYCLAPVRAAYRLIGLETAKIIRGPRRSFGYLKDPVSRTDTRKLLRYVDGNCGLRDRLIVYLMAYLGLRDVEISRLDMGDTFVEDDRLKARIWGKKRDGKDTRISLGSEVALLMLDYLGTLDRKVGEPMFLGRKGCRLRPHVISRIVSEIMRSAGVKNEGNDHRITPHSLRHTAVTTVLKKTGSIRKAQRFARHIDVRSTEVYAHDVEDTPEIEY